MTGLERLQAASLELEDALSNAIAEIARDKTGNWLEQLFDVRREFIVLRHLLSVVDRIHALRQADCWFDQGFRIAGIVTKNTKDFRYPGEKKNG